MSASGESVKKTASVEAIDNEKYAKVDVAEGGGQLIYRENE